MEKNKFALLCSQVAAWVVIGETFELYQIERLADIVKTEEQPIPNVELINALMFSMQQGRKIDAIKAYRQLTGYGLKESKDAVEKYWLTQPVQQVND